MVSPSTNVADPVMSSVTVRLWIGVPSPVVVSLVTSMVVVTVSPTRAVVGPDVTTAMAGVGLWRPASMVKFVFPGPTVMGTGSPVGLGTDSPVGLVPTVCGEIR